MFFPQPQVDILTMKNVMMGFNMSLILQVAGLESRCEDLICDSAVMFAGHSIVESVAVSVWTFWVR